MAERKRDTKRTSKSTSTASRTSARPSRAPARSSSKSAARPAAKAPAKPAAKSPARPAAKAPARPAAKPAPAKAARKESPREVFTPPLTPSPVEEIAIPALSPGEWYQQEKRRREAEGPTGSDPLAEAKREYLAMLAAEAEKGKGGRPRGSGANKGKPPVRPTVDDD